MTGVPMPTMLGCGCGGRRPQLGGVPLAVNQAEMLLWFCAPLRWVIWELRWGREGEQSLRPPWGSQGAGLFGNGSAFGWDPPPGKAGYSQCFV